MKLVLSGIIIYLFFIVSTASAKKINIAIEVYKHNQLIFTGNETVSIEKDKIKKVRSLFSVQTKKLAQKEMTELVTNSLKPISYQLENIEKSEKIEFKMVNNLITMKVTDKNNKTKSDSVKWSKKHLYSKTIHENILKNWDTLLLGKEFEFRMIVPAKRDDYGFKIKKIESKIKNRICFRMESTSWIVRQVLDPMDFYYIESRKLLTEYRGRTSIPFKGDDEFEAVIKFMHPL